MMIKPTVLIQEHPALKAFGPIPLTPLPFPSIVVASSDDPYAGIERSRAFAAGWGSRLVEVGALGHVNSESGLGDWPQGRELLAELTS
ncbi:RBBP9/YdeN family alpha/beta hydrolase [Kitasatospora sp. LaBMicrA B282]|uniref:RBBP9/YdeN family alpha/beta hydrolase n=1 Tax=Kitasatospora sp. LaBMicrA B282 TaxID=3420949 RepID=UPI003D0DC825